MLKEIPKNSKFRDDLKSLALSPGNKTYLAFPARLRAMDSLMVFEHGPWGTFASVFTFSVSGGTAIRGLHYEENIHSEGNIFKICVFEKLDSNC